MVVSGLLFPQRTVRPHLPGPSENHLQKEAQDQFLKDELEIVDLEDGVYTGGDLLPHVVSPPAGVPGICLAKTPKGEPLGTDLNS